MWVFINSQVLIWNGMHWHKDESVLRNWPFIFACLIPRRVCWCTFTSFLQTVHSCCHWVLFYLMNNAISPKPNFFWSNVEMEYFGVTMLLKCANPHLSADNKNKSNRQEWIDPEPQLCVVEIVGNVYAVLLEIVQSFWLTFLQFKAVPLVSHCGEGRTFKGTYADCPFGWLILKLPLHPLALFLWLVLMRQPTSFCLHVCRFQCLLQFEYLSCVLCTVSIAF